VKPRKPPRIWPVTDAAGFPIVYAELRYCADGVIELSFFARSARPPIATARAATQVTMLAINTASLTAPHPRAKRCLRRVSYCAPAKRARSNE
jgi:hypothetical protein